MEKYFTPKAIKPVPINNIQIPQIEKNINGTLEFINQIDDIYEIRYVENSLGYCTMKPFNDSIIEFFRLIANKNNGSDKQLENKLEQYVKNNFQEQNNPDKENTKYLRYSSSYTVSDIPYLIGLEDNIIKRTCDEYDLSYQDLADATSINIMSLRSIASSHKISRQIKRSIELYIETIELKKQLEQTNQLKSILKNWLK